MLPPQTQGQVGARPTPGHTTVTSADTGKGESQANTWTHHPCALPAADKHKAKWEPGQHLDTPHLPGRLMLGWELGQHPDTPPSQTKTSKGGSRANTRTHHPCALPAADKHKAKWEPGQHLDTPHLPGRLMLGWELGQHPDTPPSQTKTSKGGSRANTRTHHP